MRIVLRDKNPHMVAAWKEAFKDANNVTCEESDIFETPFTQAVVSPANSFGFMNGGIDGVYARRWPSIEKSVQNMISVHYFGELPVGSALAVPIHHCGECGKPKDTFIDDYKILISAPTMRTPDNVSQTINAFLAFRAVLVCALKNDILSLTCPGLGTAIGGMHPTICAIQMREAYNSIGRDPAKAFRRNSAAITVGAQFGRP